MSRTLRSQLVVGLTDRASAPANRITTALQRLRAIGQMNIGQRMGLATNQMKRSAMASATLGVGLGIVARQGFLAAYNMEKTMNKLQAVGQLTKEQREEFQAMAMLLNKDFPFTNKEIAEAGVELMKAGFTFTQAKAALKDTLRLAMAGDIDRGEAADIATNVLTAMRLPMETAEQVEKSLRRVVDNLAYAANESNTDIQKMGQTFKYVAPIAAAAGISIEEVSAMSMVMANNGIKASEAGVALRSAIVKMVRPTSFALKAFDRLNINIGDFVKSSRRVKSADIIGGLRIDGIDAEPFKKNIDKILSEDALHSKPAQLAARLTEEIAKGLGSDSVVDRKQLAESLQSVVMSSAQEVDLMGLMTQMLKNGADLKEVAEVFAVKQSGRLMTLLTADLNKKAQDVIDNAGGAAERMAAIMMGGIVGAAAKLKASWENIWITIGEAGILEQISNAFNNIAVALERVAKSSPQLLKIGTYIFGAMAIMAPLGLVLTGIAASISMLTGAISFAGLAVAGLGKVLAGPFIASAALAVRAVTKLRRGFLMLSMAGMMGGPMAVMSTAASGFFGGIKKGAMGALFSLRGLLAGVRLLLAISWPVLLGVTAIAAVIGYWDKLKAFFSEFFSELDNEFEKADLGRPLEAIAAAAKKLMGWLGDAWDYLKKLLGFSSDENGIKTWAEAGRNAARALANSLKWVIEKIQGAYDAVKRFFGLGGGGGKATDAPKVEARARGGNVRAGRPYLVGERGPELITPSRAGFVVPNHALRAAAGGGRSLSVGEVKVNVAAPQGANPAQWGREIGRAVRDEIMNTHSDGGYG